MSYLFLSISGSFEVSDFSQITGILSGYLSLILSDSLFLASVEFTLIYNKLTEIRVCLLVVHFFLF